MPPGDIPKKVPFSVSTSMLRLKLALSTGLPAIQRWVKMFRWGVSGRPQRAGSTHVQASSLGSLTSLVEVTMTVLLIGSPEYGNHSIL